MNYALIDNEGRLVMEFHTDDEAMRYARRLVINAREDLSVYKRIADIKFAEKIETTIYGD